MQLICYHLLGSRQKKLLLKTARKGSVLGTAYNPYGNGLKRLSVITGLSISEVREQLMKERKYLLEQQKVNDNLSL